MKYLLLFTLWFVAPQGETYVYICTGPQSECYHKNTFCRAFKKCSGDIKKVTLDQAKDKYKRRPCGYCYKKR